MAQLEFCPLSTFKTEHDDDGQIVAEEVEDALDESTASSSSTSNDDANDANEDDEGQPSQHQKLTSGQRALGIHLVVSRILKFVDFHDLRNCQLVNQLWNLEAKNIKVPRYVVRFHMCPNDPSASPDHHFVLTETVDPKFPSVTQTYFLSSDDLKDKLDSLQTKQIWVRAEHCNIGVGALAKFFDRFSGSITHLTYNGPFEHNSVRDFLCLHLPKLQYLAFCAKLAKPWNDAVLPILRELRTVQFLSSTDCRGASFSPIIQRIINLSPNLRSIYGFPCQLLREMSMSQCLSITHRAVIKSISNNSFYISTDENAAHREMETLSLFADLKPALKQLQFHHISFGGMITSELSKIFMAACSRILQSSANTLETLELAPLLSWDNSQLVGWPRLTALKTLAFKHHDVVGLNFFPTGLDLPWHFPNLITVELFLNIASLVDEYNAPTYFERFYPPHTFRPGHSFPTVTSLKLHNTRGLTRHFLERLASLFPNIETLILFVNIFSLDKVLPTCFKLWPRLVTIELEIFYTIIDVDWDKIITGFSTHQLNTLRALSQDQVQDNIVRRRWCSSLVNMRELRHLKFIFKSICKHVIMESPFWFSYVSDTYGFALMPNCQVTVDLSEVECEKQAAIYHLFEPIISHVTIWTE